MRVDIFATFDVAHYRPKERPNTVRVLHEKTNEENWMPLFDDNGVPLYPELMSELDAIKRDRIGGLMLTPRLGRPWPVADMAEAGQPDLTHMSRKVKEVIRAAGLRDELTFTVVPSWRLHRDRRCRSDRSPRSWRRVGTSRSKVLPRYVKRTMRQVAAGARSGARREQKTDRFVRMSSSPLVRMAD